MRALVRAVAAGVLAMSGHAAQALDLQVVEIKAYLFLEKTGKLSPNIVASAEGFWNTIIAEDPANDVLVEVVLTGDAKAPSKSATVTVTRPEFKPQPVIKKVFSDLLLQEGKTTVHKVMLVEDATCAPMTIAVRAGKSTKTAKIDFKCGE